MTNKQSVLKMARNSKRAQIQNAYVGWRPFWICLKIAHLPWLDFAPIRHEFIKTATFIRTK